MLNKNSCLLHKKHPKEEGAMSGSKKKPRSKKNLRVEEERVALRRLWEEARQTGNPELKARAFVATMFAAIKEKVERAQGQ